MSVFFLFRGRLFGAHGCSLWRFSIFRALVGPYFDKKFILNNKNLFGSILFSASWQVLSSRKRSRGEKSRKYNLIVC